MRECDWQRDQPCLFDIVTGFFPEMSPKKTWETNPRPLLVCGVAKDPEDGTFYLRVAYGTSNLRHCNENDLVIGNLSALDSLGLKKPTRFVTHSGNQMVIMPWTDEFFRPWTGMRSPVLSRLPDDMRRFVEGTLARLSDLPQF